MLGKYTCGMLTGLVAGTMMGFAAKCMLENGEKTKNKQKAKKLLNKVEKYVNDSMPYNN